MLKYLLYIDPGTGSLIYQALLSGGLAVMVYYKKIINYIKARKNKIEPEDTFEEELEIKDEANV